jgi:hypothetical protein
MRDLEGDKQYTYFETNKSIFHARNTTSQRQWKDSITMECRLLALSRIICNTDLESSRSTIARQSPSIITILYRSS